MTNNFVIRNSNINQTVKNDSTNNSQTSSGNGLCQYYETVTFNERLIAELIKKVKLFTRKKVENVIYKIKYKLEHRMTIVLLFTFKLFSERRTKTVL